MSGARILRVTARSRNSAGSMETSARRALAARVIVTDPRLPERGTEDHQMRVPSAQQSRCIARKAAGLDQPQGGPRESGCDGRWNGQKDRAGCSTRQATAKLGTTAKVAGATHLTANSRHAKHDSSQLLDPVG
jgi:hypothetical protein